MTPPRTPWPGSATPSHVFSHVERQLAQEEAQAVLLRGQEGSFEAAAAQHSHLPAPVRQRLSTVGPAAEHNVQLFNVRFAPRQARLSALFKELQDKHHKKVDALKKLRAAAQEFSALATPFSACKNRCQHCCHVPVALSQSEARLIGKQIQVQPQSPKDSAWLKEKPYGYEHPCPFLTPTGCGIYEERPLACRVYLNMDNDDLLCRLIPGQAVPVPLANATSFYQLYMKVTEGEPLADIREYFPQGLGQAVPALGPELFRKSTNGQRKTASKCSRFMNHTDGQPWGALYT